MEKSKKCFKKGSEEKRLEQSLEESQRTYWK